MTGDNAATLTSVEFKLEGNLGAAVKQRESLAVGDVYPVRSDYRIAVGQHDRGCSLRRHGTTGSTVDGEVLRNHVDDVRIIEATGDFQLLGRLSGAG